MTKYDIFVNRRSAALLTNYHCQEKRISFWTAADPYAAVRCRVELTDEELTLFWLASCDERYGGDLKMFKYDSETSVDGLFNRKTKLEKYSRYKLND